jgi:hypothetical protein
MLRYKVTRPHDQRPFVVGSQWSEEGKGKIVD